MTYTTDNRWSPGASGATDEDFTSGRAPAAYSARWIDQGDMMAADIVPDRQGFARNDDSGVVALTDRLIAHDARTLHHGVDYDVVACCVDEQDFKLFLRRAGGYIYVDAWLVP